MATQPTPLLQRPTTWIVLATALAGTLSGGVMGMALDLQRRVDRLPQAPVSARRMAPNDEASRLLASVLDGVPRLPPR